MVSGVVELMDSRVTRTALPEYATHSHAISVAEMMAQHIAGKAPLPPRGGRRSMLRRYGGGFHLMEKHGYVVDTGLGKYLQGIKEPVATLNRAVVERREHSHHAPYLGLGCSPPARGKPKPMDTVGETAGCTLASLGVLELKRRFGCNFCADSCAAPAGESSAESSAANAAAAQEFIDGLWVGGLER